MADQHKHTEIAVKSRAEAALALLRSLARAGEDPEKFAQACRDWARLSDDVESLPEFRSVLSMLTAEPNDIEAIPVRWPSEAPSPADTFTLDAKGKISSVPKDLGAQLDLKIGDLLHPSLRPGSTPDISMSGLLIERPDKSGISRQIKVYPKLIDGMLAGYTGQVFLYRLSDAVRTHLTRHFGLTTSELEILELVLRRHRLEQVADLRGIKRY